MSKQKMGGGMLMDDRPIMFLPLLAKALKSCEKAIVLQQIHWLSKQPKSGIDYDGHHWVWGSYKEWCEDYFSMWQPPTLKKHILGLEKSGYLISAQLKADEWDRTKYYRVDYDMVCLIGPSAVPSIGPDVVPSEGPDVVHSYITETSTETSSSLDDDDRASRTILSALKDAGVKVSPSLSRKYRKLEDELTTEAVIKGIEIATENGKQSNFKYVSTCARNWKNGTAPATANGGQASAREIQGW